MTAIVEEYSGSDRYETCRLIAQATYNYGTKNNDYAILASGAEFPDALAGCGLAGYLRATIILSDPSTLAASASAALNFIKPKTVYALGATAALSDAVLNSVRTLAYGPTVERICGENRFTTLATIQTLQVGLDWKPTTCIVTANSWPDALSASSCSYYHAWPIIMAEPSNNLTEPVATALSRFGECIVFGGTGAISDVQYDKIREIVPKASRISGADRIETSIKTATQLGGGDFARVGFCTAGNFPDGLTCSQLQGVFGGAPTLLVDTGGVSQAVLSWLQERKDKIKTLRFFGGTSTISQSDRNAIIAAVNN
jgi:putative cell wall-binding protein